MALEIGLELFAGLGLGIIFGFILQRGRFCMNSAIRDPLLLKEYKLIKAVFLAICVEMIGFSLLHALSSMTMAPKPFAWAPQIIGGLLFGIGMTYAAGCASGTTYRVGEGMMGSLVALLGYALGAYITKFGPLVGLKDKLWTTKIMTADGASLTIGGQYTWIVMLVLGVAGLGVFIWKAILPEIKKRTEEDKAVPIGQMIFKKSWTWYITGIAIGVLAIFAWISSNAAGRNYGLGITGGWVGVTKFLTSGDIEGLSWEAFLVLGVVVGAFISSMVAGEFKLRAPKEGKTLLLQFCGGLLMGIGAIFASGCNIGNFLSGVPLLSIGSIVASISIVLGCWLMTYLLFMRD